MTNGFTTCKKCKVEFKTVMGIGRFCTYACYVDYREGIQ